MEDLTLFTQSLIQKKEDEFGRQLDRYKQELLQKKEDTISKINEQVAQTMRKIDETTQQDLHMALQKIANDMRNDVLVAKQEQLLALFDEAKLQMGQWSANQTAQFFNQVSKQLPKGNYVVKRGELTPLTFDLPENMVLCEDVIANEYGFTFESDGIVYNFLYQSLLQDLKQTYIGTLMTKLNQ